MKTERLCITADGRVFDETGEELKQTLISGGRPAVHVNGAPVVVARLVAQAFVPNPDDLPLVRHLDGNPANNWYDNLAWGTHQDNADDRALHGKTYVGEEHGKAKLTEEEVKAIRWLMQQPEFSSRKVARMYNISPGTVLQIHHRKTWTHVN